MEMKYFRDLSFVLLACAFICMDSSEAGKIPGSKPARQKSDDLLVVSNPKTPKNPSLRIVFKEDLTIGVREGDENYMFGKQAYFNVDDDGNIFVTDWDRKRIQKYGPDGKYLLTIGREGQGPGEFHNVFEPEFDKDGNLYVVDIDQKRVSFFSRDGRYIRQTKVPGVDVSGNLYILSQGKFLTALSETTRDDEAGSEWTRTVGLYDERFAPLTMFHRELHESKSPKSRGEDDIAQFWAGLISDTAFKPAPHYLLAPNGEIFFGFSNAYEIKVYSPEGKLMRIVKKDYNPAPVAEKDKNQFEKTQAADFVRFLPSQLENAKKKALRLIRYPKYKPAYEGFTLADNGWLFVIVNNQGNEATVLDVFDAQGLYIARTEAAIPAEKLRFKKGKAYCIATDEEGYKSLKRYSYVARES